MLDSVLDLLRGSQLACGLSDDQLARVAMFLELKEVSSGDAVFEQDRPGTSLFIVARGRIKVSVLHPGGNERFVDYLAVGEHFGEMAMLTGGHRAATMTAVMDSVLLELDQRAFEKLTTEVPGLAANLSRTLGYRLRRETTGQRPRNMPRVIGMVHTSAGTRQLLPLISKAFADTKAPIRVIAEFPFRRRHSDIAVLSVPQNTNESGQLDWIHDRLATGTGHAGHTLVALKENASREHVATVTRQCEAIWWLVDPKDTQHATRRLENLIASEPEVAARVHWVWVIDQSQRLEELPAKPAVLKTIDFKVLLGERRLQAQSLSRLVRHTRGTRLGLALGGGAARGLAHLGVLKALEDAEIHIDMIVGTSAGALMALPYCFGWDLEFIKESFQRDLTPTWPFRLLPRGKEWFMVYKYRTNGWDGMLRHYFGNIALEQLLIPLSTVTADLITGQQVVRDAGDAIHGVLESINLPSIARPILRDGMALVDGGIVNNVPTDLLAERGADLAVGVDIGRKLAQRFGKNTPNMLVDAMQKNGQFETIMRANEVQDHAINDLRNADVDHIISVDTSEFAFADFTKANELAEAGERAMQQNMPDLKRLLSEQRNSQSLHSSLRFSCPQAKSRQPKVNTFQISAQLPQLPQSPCHSDSTSPACS